MFSMRFLFSIVVISPPVSGVKMFLLKKNYVLLEDSPHTDAQPPLPTFKFFGVQDLDVGIQLFHSFHAQSLG